MGHVQPIFFVFSIEQLVETILPMSGFEQQISGVGATGLPTEPQPLPFFYTIAKLFPFFVYYTKMLLNVYCNNKLSLDENVCCLTQHDWTTQYIFFMLGFILM